jgi:vacuolar-type H+-ATPase subunit H
MREMQEMQDIVQRILTIDRNARDIIQRNEEERETREGQARSRLEQMSKEEMDQAEQQGRALYDRKMKEAEEETQHISTRNAEAIQSLEQHFLAVEDSLEADIFREIFLEPETREGKSNQ